MRVPCPWGAPGPRSDRASIVDMLRECPSKPRRLRCLAAPPGTEVSRRCVDNGATTGAGSDGGLGPRTGRPAGRKAGRAGAGPRSGSFHGLRRRSGPGARPPPARPGHRRRRRARRSRGGHACDCARPAEKSPNQTRVKRNDCARLAEKSQPNQNNRPC